MYLSLLIRRFGRLLILLPVGLAACSTPPVREPVFEPADALIVEVKPAIAPAQTPALSPDSAVLAAPPQDLWERLRAGFALSPGEDQPHVQDYLAWHRSNPDYLERVSARAEPFLYFILEEIERRGMPSEIALLPVVESAFVPLAYSRSHAAGMWQFIPSTGMLFGLKQNWWYDGRRDVYASTHAALDYLEKLHARFEGDWLLALAAYNGGPGTVSRAIEANRRLGRPLDYWHLDLPSETERYLPKLLAVKAVVDEPERFGITLTPILNEPRLATVDIDSQIDLALVAELAELEIETLYQLNAGFNRWATDPDGPHRLLLPLASIELFENRLAELPAENRVTWLRHEIESGDTLIEIANRHHTTVATLQETNRLSGSLIRAGHYLLVPQSVQSLESYTLTADERRTSVQSNGEGQRIMHVVSRGESLWGIAQRYGIGVRELAGWNAMAPGDVLKTGAALAIWRQAGTAGFGLPAVHQGPGQTVRTVSYAVRDGDSLYAIARRFSVSVSDLRRWNEMHNTNLLHPGQALTVHVDATRLGL